MSGNAYSIAERGSNSVPWIRSALYFRGTLRRIVAASQKSGCAEKIRDYSCFVPLNAARRVLTLVDETDRVAEFMKDRLPIQPAQIQRRRMEQDLRIVGAHIGSGPIVGIEGHSDLSPEIVGEFKVQVRKLGSFRSNVPDHGFPILAALRKPDAECASIDPLLADRAYGTLLPADRAGPLRTVRVTRQNSIETYFPGCRHRNSPSKN